MPYPCTKPSLIGVLNFIQSLQLFTFCGCTRCLPAIAVFLNKANEYNAFGQEWRMYLASAGTEHYRRQITVCSIFAWMSFWALKKISHEDVETMSETVSLERFQMAMVSKFSLV